MPCLVRLRIEQIKIAVAPRADDAAAAHVVLCIAATVRAGVVHHLGAPRAFVKPMRIVEVVANLVLKMPRQLVVKVSAVRIVFQSPVTNQLNAALDPVPAYVRCFDAIELHRDVV